MKKVLTLMLALVMAFCLAVPAFAAESITDGVTVAGAENLTVTSTDTPFEAKSVLHSILGSTPAGKLTTVYLHNVSGATPVTLTFTVAGADANDKLYVLHYNGSNWELLKSGTGSSITVTFNSLSPVAVVLEEVSASDTGTSGSAPTAPQTGDSMAVPFFGLAVIALAGIVAYKARKKEM